MTRIVLAYSGGLDTSVAIPWLKEKYGAEVIAVTLDLGQGRELNQIRERAMAAGAVRCHVLDVREEFARDYILPALQAGALYEERYPLATALGRPLIAKKLVEIAQMENATAIAHGCTGKGNDQVRIDVSAGPSIRRMTVDRARARVGHDAAGRDRVRARPRNVAGAGHECEPVQHRPEPLGPLDRVRRARGPVERAAGRHLHADEIAGGRARRAGLRRDRVAERRADRGERRRDAARRAHRVASRPSRACTASAASTWSRTGSSASSRARSTRRRPRSCSTPRTRARGAGHSEGPPASEAAPLAGIRRHRLQRPVVLADARGDRRVRAERSAARHRHGPPEALQGRLPRGGRKSPFALYDQGLATYDEGDNFDHTAAEGFIKIWGLPVETAAKSARRQAAPASK